MLMIFTLACTSGRFPDVVIGKADSALPRVEKEPTWAAPKGDDSATAHADTPAGARAGASVHAGSRPTKGDWGSDPRQHVELCPPLLSEGHEKILTEDVAHNNPTPALRNA